MAKFQSTMYMPLFAFSIILNLLLLSGFYNKAKWGELPLHWTQPAAEEAEAVAALPCSGHGLAFLDGQVVDGSPVCECHACFAGPDCSVLSTFCVADADGGDPLFLEPFWRKHASSSAVMVAGWHRMSYRFKNESFISKELDKNIRKIHDIVGNAVTKGKHIVFGTGSTQLLIAAVHALSLSSSASTPARVFASVPFYPLYQVQTEYFKTEKYKFEGDAFSWKNNSNSSRDGLLIEFVTSPNNPDCQLKSAVLDEGKTIHDHAYYWPHFTPIPSPSDHDLVIFSLSKLTGHAGSRFGWAVVKDEEVYERMIEYVSLNTMGTSHDTQLRALQLLKSIVSEDQGKRLFKYGYETMLQRWLNLSDAFALTRRFSLQVIPPQYCTFYQQVKPPSPAYAWIKCNRQDEKDCYEVLKAGGIIGRRGNLFGVEDRFVRLSLLKSPLDFDLLLHKLHLLVANDNYGPHKI